MSEPIKIGDTLYGVTFGKVVGARVTAIRGESVVMESRPGWNRYNATMPLEEAEQRRDAEGGWKCHIANFDASVRAQEKVLDNIKAARLKVVAAYDAWKHGGAK